ncbi:hypothetical protein CE91St56_46850 [Lachnospiraceae bacterium]|nr:hypothetical protein CE91St56_46850 [Lachnospiraceae bacterium]
MHTLRGTGTSNQFNGISEDKFKALTETTDNGRTWRLLLNYRRIATVFLTDLSPIKKKRWLTITILSSVTCYNVTMQKQR